MEPVILNLNTLFPGKPSPQDFSGRVAAHDFSDCTGQHVQLRGCAPTWAHLIVAARLLPIVSGIDFLIDDGKSGIVVPIVRP